MDNREMILEKWRIKAYASALAASALINQPVIAVTFSSIDYVVGTSPFAVTSGDFNQDGAPDLAVASVGEPSVSVMLNRNDLSGVFNTHADYSVGSGPRSVTTADFNRDGALDLAVSSFFSDTISVFLNKNNQTGAFNAKTDYATAVGPSTIISADFNGDGVADLAVSNRDSNTVSVLLNVGDISGNFGIKSDYRVGLSPLQITAGDFNGDGAPDLAVAANGSDVVSVLMNKGNLSGYFNTRVDYPVGAEPVSVVSNDYNGDGALDLAVGNNLSRTVSVFLNKNDSSGGFNTSVDYIVAGNPYSIISEDFDGDGAFDLATLSSQENVLSVLLNKNDMSGAFNARTDFAVGNVPVSLASGDFNGDGDIDLAASSLSSSLVTVMLNTTGREPDVFGFIDKEDMELSTVITSNVITITGLDIPVPISVSGGEYSINNVAFTASDGTIHNNDLLQVRTTSSADYGVATSVEVTIASVTGIFMVTTLQDTVPDDYSFIDQDNVAPGTSVTSSPVTITGLGASAIISVSGGEYSINNGSFTDMDGFINNADMVVARHTSSPAARSTVDTSITIGGVSDTFSSTTSAVESVSGSLDLFLLFGLLFIMPYLRKTEGIRGQSHISGIFLL